ncbi:MAG TPA: hypothetical protein VMV46_03595 [Thermoanaerobaculia bacterium]|nr:hypothetical protein [Thermoanaerobaculia bacterium]
MAGLRTEVNGAVPWLEGRVAPPCASAVLDRPSLAHPAGLRVEGSLGEAPCEISVESDGARLVVEIASVATCQVDPSASALSVVECPEARDELLVQAMLGPALTLLLASRGILSLHASAVARDGRAVLFVGESGAGKSTLAADLGARGWTWVADDVVPLARTANGLRARPWFPQLRLPPERQYRGEPELEVAAVCALERGEGVTLTERPARQALVTLLHNTVAARLFTPDLLDWHLAWTTRAVAETPVYELRYPRRLEALAVVAETLDRAFAAGR